MLLASFSFSAVILVFFISIVTEDIMVSIFIKIDTVPRARLQPEHHPKKKADGHSRSFATFSWTHCPSVTRRDQC